TRIDSRARPRHHVAHHLFTIDRVRHAHGRHLDQFGALHQEAVDLDRRNVHATADDQLLRAAGEVEKAVIVQKSEIAGADAAAAGGRRAAVLGQVAVGVAGKAADLDLADLAYREPPAAGIDDRKVVIAQRPADRAEPA